MVKTGVMVGPEPAITPPHEPVYHFQFDPGINVPPVADKVLITPGQTFDGLTVKDAGTEFNVTVIVELEHNVVLQGPTART